MSCDWSSLRSTTSILILTIVRLHREFLFQRRIKTVGGPCWRHAFDITVIARDAFMMTTTRMLLTTKLLTSVSRTSFAHPSATSTSSTVNKRLTDSSTIHVYKMTISVLFIRSNCIILYRFINEGNKRYIFFAFGLHITYDI